MKISLVRKQGVENADCNMRTISNYKLQVITCNIISCSVVFNIIYLISISPIQSWFATFFLVGAANANIPSSTNPSLERFRAFGVAWKLLSGLLTELGMTTLLRSCVDIYTFQDANVQQHLLLQTYQNVPYTMIAFYNKLHLVITQRYSVYFRTFQRPSEPKHHQTGLFSN